MVKTLIGILISFLLLVGASFYEVDYVEKEFGTFSGELESLYDKTENETATREDAEAVRLSWNEKKKSLHVWVPHNDISYIDYWLSEGLSLIDTGNFDEALSKIEVLIQICENIPSAYSFAFENIF